MNRIVRHKLKQVVVALSWLLLFSWFDRLAVLFVATSGRRAGMLLVKMEAIGDFVLATPVIRALCEEAGQEPVTLVCDARSAPLARLLFPQIQVVGVDIWKFVKNPAYRWTMLRLMARVRARLGINLALGPELWWGNSLIRCCGAPVRQGIFPGYDDRLVPSLIRLCARWYTQTVPLAAHDHFVSHNLRSCVAALGHRVGEMRPPPLVIPESAAAKAPDTPYFVVAPGSLRAIKKWPAERFAQVALRLQDRTGWRGVLLGAPSDAAAARAVLALADGAVTDLVGQTSLIEAVAILQRSRLLIANDSALVHIAALCGVPTVATLGGGHPARFLPYPPDIDWLRPVTVVMHPLPCYNCDWRCIYPIGGSSPAPCVADIGVERFWCAVEQVAGLA